MFRVDRNPIVSGCRKFFGGGTEEYNLVWSDEFEGTELNRSDWNVELHNPGWVNSELQAYVDSEDNIKVQDGKLYIYPKKTVTVETSGNLLTNADFSSGMDGWSETIADWDPAIYSTKASSSISGGSIVYTIDNPGGAEWHVQLKQEGINLEAGKKYTVSFKIKSTAARQMVAGIQADGTENNYTQYGQAFPSLEANVEQTVSFEATSAEGYSNGVLYFSLGKRNGVTTPGSTVTISDISVVEKPANLLTNADFSSGMAGWSETIANWGGEYVTDASSSISGDAIEYTINNPGTAEWHVQLKQEGIKLAAGKKYIVSFKIKSTAAREMVAGIQADGTDNNYTQYGQAFPSLEANVEQTVTFEATSAEDYNNGVLYFSLGKREKEGVSTSGSTVTISDISVTEKQEAGRKTVTYTSGRISTQNKQTFTYGRFEVKAKVPAGQGYLPAFWLMANDENLYGQWPRCGEIDCMEVMGQTPAKVYGTIHYGNPHSESQGTKTLSSGSFADDFHTFTCDWEPGKITWYVDGVKYHEENNWYSTTEGQGTLTYPAPFDQPFYVILNLAVGGSWVGNPDDTTNFVDNPYIIDYVRVYQKDSYDENVEKPVVDVTLRDPDATGNYINNGTFANEDLTDDVNWKFLTANGGAATATIADNKINIETTNAGTVDYSVQLVQAGIPLQRGATYEVSFDAYADAARTMNVDVKAPDHGYKSYMPTKVPELTTTKQTYKYSFVMKDDSDANGRLEFNMGAGSTVGIHISNVSIKKTADPDPNAVEEKTVLADGNYIYNGSFQEGKDRLGYWDISSPENVKVTDLADGRRLKVTVPQGTDYVTISQSDLAFTSGTPYEFSFSAQTDKDTDVRIVVGGKKYKVPVTAGEKKTYTFKVPESFEFTNKDVVIKVEEGSTVYLDDIKMTEQSLIKNGNFNAGLSGYEVYVDSSANATYVVDSLKEDNALSLTITNPGNFDWTVQVKQNNVKLINGHKYKLSLKIKSDVERPVRIIMQGGESLNWPVYSNDDNATVNVGETFYDFEDTFTMNAETDPAAFLSICLGKFGEGDYLTHKHVVVIDDISLVDLTADGDEEILYEDNDPDEEPPKDKPEGEKPDAPPANIEKPDANKPAGTDKAPYTGDDRPVALVFGIMLLSGTAIIILKKKKKA